VFEPNDESLWARIREAVETFMYSLFRQGAFPAESPRDAYFVKCDMETTTLNDVNSGIVNILVGFAPLKPAEFVVLKFQRVVGQTRFDPYKNFKFRVKWDGRYVAGFSKVSALEGSTGIVEHREGGDASNGLKLTGRNKHEAVTLERGVTHDKDFEEWANTVSNLSTEVSLEDLRNDILLEAYDGAGQLTLAYKIYRCWVSELQELPDLDASANAVAIERITLENEGWERLLPQGV
jgi:phage tail-like protein